jgi:hypothetical protein
VAGHEPAIPYPLDLPAYEELRGRHPALVRRRRCQMM